MPPDAIPNGRDKGQAILGEGESSTLKAQPPLLFSRTHKQVYELGQERLCSEQTLTMPLLLHL